MLESILKFLRSHNILKHSSKSSDTTVPHDHKTNSEVTIPVSWGYISGKWWGPQHKRPILLIHGLKENSGTFDRLIPLLVDNVGFLAIDLMGHGRSSHIPDGMLYSDLLVVYLICHIKTYFEWDYVSLIGHSAGAVFSFLYTLMYPNSVDLLILLDAIHPPYLQSEMKAAKMISDMTRFFELVEMGTVEPTPTTLNDLKNIIYIQSKKSITPNNVQYILERAVKPSTKATGTYYLGTDPRVDAFGMYSFSDNDCIVASKELKCPVLMVKTDRSLCITNELVFMKFFRPIMNSSKACELHEISGTHHVHLNEPEKVATVINSFVKRNDVISRFRTGNKSMLVNNTFLFGNKQL